MRSGKKLQCLMSCHASVKNSSSLSPILHIRLERLDNIFCASVCNLSCLWFHLPPECILSDLDDSIAITHCVVICIFVYPHQALLIKFPEGQTLIRKTGFCNKSPHVSFLILLVYFFVSTDYYFCVTAGFRYWLIPCSGVLCLVKRRSSCID